MNTSSPARKKKERSWAVINHTSVTNKNQLTPTIRRHSHNYHPSLPSQDRYCNATIIFSLLNIYIIPSAFKCSSPVATKTFNYHLFRYSHASRAIYVAIIFIVNPQCPRQTFSCHVIIVIWLLLLPWPFFSLLCS